MIQPNAQDLEAKAQLIRSCPRLLDKMAEEAEAAGLVGEARNFKLLALCVTSRLTADPVSIVIKGSSGGGKSATVEVTLKFFPRDCYRAYTSVSEKALLYDKEPLKHKFLIFYEAAGLNGEFMTYIIRSLISEKRLSYLVTEKPPDGGGYEARFVEREGPTGFILTTTLHALEPELESRLLTLTVDDGTEQTKRILLLQAVRTNGVTVDFAPYQTHQQWIAEQRLEVVIPFAEELARLCEPRSLRFRRDFPKVLTLTKSHALLHAGLRACDSEGHIIATIEDYAVVHGLISDLIQDNSDNAIPTSVRQTVEAVKSLRDGLDRDPSIKDLAERLVIHQSAASRRVTAAVESGYLKKIQVQARQRARLVVGIPLSEEEGRVLASPDEVERAYCIRRENDAHAHTEA